MVSQDDPKADGWDGKQYTVEAAHHRSYDDWFLNRHPPRHDDRVVDAGCGTGEFAARLATLVPAGEVVGVEPAESMLAVARRHTEPNLRFFQGTLQGLGKVISPAWADLVVSRAVFHWIPLSEYPDCYRAVLSSLRPGGWFHAESGGAGNVRRVVAVLNDIAEQHGLPPVTMPFPDAGVILDMLEQVGFEVPDEGVRTVAQRRIFDRDSLMGFLRTQAVVAYVGSNSQKLPPSFLTTVEQRLDDFRRHDGTYDQTFVRLEVLCQRPG